ncbi:D-alanyl-D-alanine carboxypeptidase family protein [Polymorphum gilvum]|uniref:D-alanyl-D-alanine carboxypeptidase superfamily n=1 Tax=Polymorphum gilvum (strain LMG 25793 / CGMCC 1.9160 / SL003B-26A1) TaxID=991905 RepID=F2J2C8_POLGS|nr:D-alanyl-D-alanine carboxypeptidase family protein [Polymorphum gilvum]ADZ69824.1 D-alanyl-D-alanine carboxypeptidase superfamily [Polymorphum gilvum SL003B-26A1]
MRDGISGSPFLTVTARALAALALLTLAACQSGSGDTRQAGLAPQVIGSAQAAVAPTAVPDPVTVDSVALVPASAEARGHAALVIDAASGAELFAANADAPRYPASLTKMMTLYLLFEAVERGELTLDTPLAVSARAAARPPAKIGLATGSTITVREAAQALAVRSANDVAVAIAERLAGSESAFAAQMTAKARSLGMSRTRFVNASGLADTRQVTTARDMAILGRALKARFPQYAAYFRATSFAYNGRTFEATNKLLGRVPGVDGLKTGYIGLSGYNLVATGSRGGRGFVVVVMGGKSESARDAEVTRLIETYF